MNKCKCGKIIGYRAKHCASCAKKGKLNPMFGKPSSNKGLYGNKAHNWKGGITQKYCLDCGKKLHNFYAKRCRECFEQKIIGTVSKRIVKHHIDMNKNNNSKNNFLYLTVKNHLNLHKFAYLYIVKKFGIKEIIKYIKWFQKYYAK